MLPMKKYLSRKEASAYLTAIGFHTTYKTLGKLATIGGGPKFHKFGTKCVLYAIEDLDAWAAERLSPAFKSTSDKAGAL